MTALGITARSSYMEIEPCSDMPSSTEVEGGGGVAAEIVQSAEGGRSV